MQTERTESSTRRKLPTGIDARHSRACASRAGATCSCAPSYRAWAYSKRDKKKLRKTFAGPGALAAAKRWRADAMSGLGKGTLRAPTNQTLEGAAEVWLDGAKAGVIRTRGGAVYKPSVIRGYEADLRRYVLPDLGAVRLAELRRSDVQALVDRLARGGKSASKIANVVMPIRAVCRHAIERDLLVINPTRDLRLPAAEGTRDRVASAAEAAELVAALKEEDRALWAAAVYAGLRRGELRALRWSDVDLTANVIIVERGWDEKEGVIDPKSKKGRRRVPIVGPLRLLLLEHQARTGRRGDDLVFGSKRDHPFTPTNIRKRALHAWKVENEKRAKANDGLPDEEQTPPLVPIGLHELRHTYVSLMHDAGFPLERIGDYVGHSSTYMTDRYRHLLDGHEADAAKRFNEYLTKSSER